VCAVHGDGGSRPRPMAGRTSAASPQLGGVGARSACGAAGAAVVGRRARGDARGAAERRQTCARPLPGIIAAVGRPPIAVAAAELLRDRRAPSACQRGAIALRQPPAGNEESARDGSRVLGGCGGRRPARAEGRVGPGRAARFGEGVDGEVHARAHASRLQLRRRQDDELRQLRVRRGLRHVSTPAASRPTTPASRTVVVSPRSVSAGGSRPPAAASWPRAAPPTASCTRTAMDYRLSDRDQAGLGRD